MPVGTVQSGSVTATTGSGGFEPIITVVADVHVVTSLTVTVYPVGLGVTPGNTGDAWKLIPSIEYVYCAPSGDETVMVEVVAVHVGEAEAFGTGGADGAGFTIGGLTDAVHPFASFTVSV